MGLLLMKNRVAFWLAIGAVCTCLATAQNSQVHSSAAKSTPDPLKSATKPLTPKSGTTPHHSSPSVPTSKPASTGNTNAELTRLERQKVTTKGPKPGAGTPKNPTGSKPADTSSASGPGINYKYQKPAGGMEAATPNAHSPNSNTPRVTKKN